MEKEQIKKSINKIEVPAESVQEAFRKGILKANKEQHKSFFSRHKVITSSLVAIAAAFIVITCIPNEHLTALESIPIIGQYLSFKDSVGKRLFSKGMTTPEQLSVSDQGYTVTIDGTYYDGGQIGFLYTVIPDENIANEIIPDPQIWWEVNSDEEALKYALELGSANSNKLQRNDENRNYFGEVALPYSLKEDENYILPIAVKEINGIKGDWAFNIPIKSHEMKVINADEKQNIEDMEFGISRVLIREEIASIEYELIQPKRETEPETIPIHFHLRNPDGNDIGASFIMSGQQIDEEDLGDCTKGTYRTMLMLKKDPNNPLAEQIDATELIASVTLVTPGRRIDIPLASLPSEIIEYKGESIQVLEATETDKNVALKVKAIDLKHMKQSFNISDYPAHQVDDTLSSEEEHERLVAGNAFVLKGGELSKGSNQELYNIVYDKEIMFVYSGEDKINIKEKGYLHVYLGREEYYLDNIKVPLK